jgi:phage terminase Nu1 subunit (DNA packaging protein)
MNETTRDAEVELSWLRHRLGEVLEVDAKADVVAEVRRVVRERDDALSRLAAAQAKGER